jgi:hypothetical protein
MELDWSRRKIRAVGLLRLIWAEYGTEAPFPRARRNQVAKEVNGG